MEWFQVVSQFISNVGFPIALIMLMGWCFKQMMPKLGELVARHIEFLNTLEKNNIQGMEILRQISDTLKWLKDHAQSQEGGSGNRSGRRREPGE